MNVRKSTQRPQRRSRHGRELEVDLPELLSRAPPVLVTLADTANRDRRGLRLGGPIVMSGEDIAHRVAVGYDIAVKVPRASQGLLQQEAVGARGLPVHRHLGAQDRAGMPLHHRGAKCRQIGVIQTVQTDVLIDEVPHRLRSAIGIEVLRRGDRPSAAPVRAVHAGHTGDRQSRAEEWILPAALPTATPGADLGRCYGSATSRMLVLSGFIANCQARSGLRRKHT